MQRCAFLENKSVLKACTMINETIKKSIQSSVLCWLATVDDSGQPHVSPKEIFAAVDDKHIVIAHIASPHTVRNIASHPKVCLSFVDVFAQKGFKLQGIARIVKAADPDYATWAEPLLAMVEGKFKIPSVIVMEVQAIDPILAPSYRFYPEATTEDDQIASAMRRYGVQPKS
jgi:predicted pyridoxine 5'-phosphate oxidase superfamily flavin-nucleotide-binding protein